MKELIFSWIKNVNCRHTYDIITCELNPSIVIIRKKSIDQSGATGISDRASG